MRTHYRLFVGVLFVLSMVLAACSGGNQPSTAPTVAPASPTSAPTATPTAVPTVPPPTSAPVVAPTTASQSTSPTTAGNLSALPQDLLNALNKTKDLQKVRYEITMKTTYTKNGQSVDLTPTTVTGESNGVDQHITFSGANESTGKAESFEMISAGNAVYIKGALGMPGQDPNAWYQVPPQMGQALGSAPTAHGLLSGLNPADFQPGNFKATGTEILDLQPCTVWTAQNPNVMKDLAQTGNEDVNRELQAIDTSDARIWTCLDGVMHQIKGTATGHDPNSPSDKAKVETTMHIFDINANITIAPPASATPFTIPGLTLPTKTP